MKQGVIFFLLLLIPFQSFASVDGYTTIRYRKQTLHISDIGLKDHTKEMKEGVAFLKQALNVIDDLPVGDKVKKRLRSIPIFVEWDLGDAGAMYHPNKTWLIEHNYIPVKEKSIEITNITHYVERTKLNQPYLLIHEMSHAYMDRYMTKKEKDDIGAAYRKAVRDGNYKSVEYTPGGDMVKVQKEAYALTNEFEYFAEVSEAYLGQNDFYPYNREDLKKHDPYVYKILAKIWK